MERIMTALTDKQQALAWAILLAGMRTARARLRGVVGINLDRHTVVEHGFVSDQGMQRSPGPFGMGGIGFALTYRRLFAMVASCPLTNVCQVFQTDETVGVLIDDAPTHDVVAVRFQPSLSSADLYQTFRSGTSAFTLQPLLE